MAQTNSPSEGSSRHVESASSENPNSAKWSMSSVKTQSLDAGGIFLGAIVVAATRAEKFGQGLFCYQLCFFLLGLCAAPSLHRRSPFLSRFPLPSSTATSSSSTSSEQSTSNSSPLPPSTTIVTPRTPRIVRWVFVACAVLWTFVCAMPVFYALMIELFTGHRRPGAQWYDGVWRVYAIVLLWLAISVFHLRVIKPWWQFHSDRLLSGVRKNSVSLAVNRAANVRRDEKLKAMRGRYEILVRRRARTKSRLSRCEAIKAKLETTISMLQPSLSCSSSTGKIEGEISKEHVEDKHDGLGEDDLKANDTEKEPVSANAKDLEDLEETKEDLLQTMEKMRELEEELEEVEDDIKSLRLEWTEALHINNHVGFYH